MTTLFQEIINILKNRIDQRKISAFGARISLRL